MALNSRGHDEGEGEGRDGTDLAIAVRVLFELNRLPIDGGHKFGITDLKIFFAGQVGRTVEVDL
jgi:hypothetical protein